MKVYGSLERASFEVLTSDPSAGVTGRFWFNSTEGRAKLDDGTLIRALLRNDQKLILGNSGTAAENIRLHRGAAGVLQFVSGADTTAEGSMSTALNQISARAENYANFASLPAVGNAGRIAYVSSETQAYIDNGTAWEKVGSGSGSANNLMAEVNPDFEISSIAGWVKGNVTLDATTKFPSGTPTFGSGASGTLAITAQSSGALDGAYSLQYADSAATTAGNFVASDAFSVSPAYRAQPLAIAFKYSVTAGAANGVFAGNTTNSFGIAIYDVTNAQFIQPAGCFQIVQSSGVGTILATFQTSASGASYRLVVYNANATSGAITLLMDNFYVGPQNVAYGVPVTDWQEFTPTGSWNTNTTYTGRWKRIGDTEIYQVKVALSGAPNSATLSINLRPGSTIDTSKLVNPVTDLQVLGQASMLDDGSAVYFGTVVYNNATSIRVQPKVVDALTIGALRNPGPVTETNPMTWANNDNLVIEFSVPIQGLSSNTVMSSDTGNARVGVSGYNPTATITGSYSIFKYQTITKDEDGSYDPVTGLFTVKSPGWLDINARQLFSGTFSNNGYANIAIAKNGTVYKEGGGRHGAWADVFSDVTVKDYFLPGQTIAIHGRSDGSGVTLNTSENYSYFSITRSNSPATIAASEDVSLKYKNTAGTSIPNATPTKVPFATKKWDTHGLWNGTDFIANSPGRYKITAAIGTAGVPWTQGQLIDLNVWKNNDYLQGDSLGYFRAGYSGTYGGFVVGSTSIDLLPGESVQIMMYHDLGSSLNLETDQRYNLVVIEKASR